MIFYKIILCVWERMCENINVSVCFTPARVIRSRRSQGTGPPLHVERSSSGHWTPPACWLTKSSSKLRNTINTFHSYDRTALVPPTHCAGRPPRLKVGGWLTFCQSPPPKRQKNKKLRIFYKGVGYILYDYSIFHKGVIGRFLWFLWFL